MSNASLSRAAQTAETIRHNGLVRSTWFVMVVCLTTIGLPLMHALDILKVDSISMLSSLSMLFGISGVCLFQFLFRSETVLQISIRKSVLLLYVLAIGFAATGNW